MRTWKVGGVAALLGAAFGFLAPSMSPAFAASDNQSGFIYDAAESGAHLPATAHYSMPLNTGYQVKLVKNEHAYSRYAAGHKPRPLAVKPFRISCVPYARQASGILVTGNAWQWWHNAVGLYARGDRPEVGSVLNFRSNPRMPLGHVAVVDRVINAREIEVEHANWGNFGMRGPIARGVTIVDVSEANNWSAVRVELARGDDFGSVYPTYGFIYNRPDTGVITASVHVPAPQPDINPATTDLRPRAEQPWRIYEEVAEAPQKAPRRTDLRVAESSSSR